MSMTMYLERLSSDENLEDDDDEPATIKMFAADPSVNESGTLDLHKSWHGLHFLLTGDAWGGEGPLAFLLLGGVPKGEDTGYGPPREFSIAKTRVIEGAISEISHDDLWANFDAESMQAQEIYPGIWDESESDLREEYTQYFDELKAFLNECVRREEGMRIVLT